MARKIKKIIKDPPSEKRANAEIGHSYKPSTRKKAKVSVTLVSNYYRKKVQRTYYFTDK